ncbi:MAG: integration host factor subunit alpha [Rickettsiales bacterium]|jgi:nucleoid DNA-binding protein|nr:integration host factor subunit alpha [Rickettsiales bacterium]
MDAQNVKKIDISTEVARGTGLSLIDAAAVVDLFFDIICDGLAKDGEVKIMGLGTFIVKHKNARTGRNPKTGAPATIEARNVISFRPAKDLRKTLK